MYGQFGGYVSSGEQVEVGVGEAVVLVLGQQA